jgi:pantoate--beta-alanine ligase
LRDAAALVLRSAPGVTPDYLAIVDPRELAPVSRADAGTIAAIAARFGKVRLIDNVILGPGGALDVA